MKSLLLATTLLLVGATAVACGSDDSSSSASDAASSASSSASASPSESASASTDPSTDPSGDASAGAATSADPSAVEFCAALTSGAALEDGKDIAALYKKLAAIPRPDAIPDDADKGYDVYLDVLKGIDPATTAEELKAMDDLGLSTEQQTEVQSFFTYASQTCVPAAASAAPSAPAS